jgi:hypothetical protein
LSKIILISPDLICTSIVGTKDEALPISRRCLDNLMSLSVSVLVLFGTSTVLTFRSQMACAVGFSYHPSTLAGQRKMAKIETVAVYAFCMFRGL